MGLLTPARPIQTELEAEEIVDVLGGDDDLRADDVRATATLIRGSVSACDRLIETLHPWTSFLIVPMFALANAGIVLTGDALAPFISAGRCGGGTRRRQAGRYRLVQLDCRPSRLRPTPQRRALGSHRRRRRGRRDRLHRVAVHHRACLRLTDSPRRRQDRHARQPRSSPPSPVRCSSPSPVAGGRPILRATGWSQRPPRR